MRQNTIGFFLTRSWVPLVLMLCKPTEGLLSVGRPCHVQSAWLDAVRVRVPRKSTELRHQHGSMKDEQNKQESQRRRPELKEKFQKLLNSILEAKDPDHIPSILAKNFDFLLDLAKHDGLEVANSIVDDAHSDGDESKAANLHRAAELSFSFVEDFVVQTSKIDAKNKELMGKILRIVSSKELTSGEREEALDNLFVSERDSLTPGFLRYVENECDRIASATTKTQESSRLLEIMRIIHARVVEELGEDLGEAAQVLGQLIGYETTVERLAVLQAGLTVRGLGFAHELKQLTEEALDGFQRVSKKVDQGLISIVEELDISLNEYIEENSQFG